MPKRKAPSKALRYVGPDLFGDFDISSDPADAKREIIWLCGRLLRFCSDHNFQFDRNIGGWRMTVTRHPDAQA